MSLAALSPATSRPVHDSEGAVDGFDMFRDPVCPSDLHAPMLALPKAAPAGLHKPTRSSGTPRGRGTADTGGTPRSGAMPCPPSPSAAYPAPPAQLRYRFRSRAALGPAAMPALKNTFSNGTCFDWGQPAHEPSLALVGERWHVAATRAMPEGLHA